MQIVGIAAELELTDDLRIGRGGQIDGKDRIRLAVGAQIAIIPVEACGEHRLPFGDPGHAADGVQVTVEHVHIIARLRGVVIGFRVFKVMLFIAVDAVGIRLLGRGQAQIAVALVERELVVERAGHSAIGGKGELAVGDRKAVDRRVDAGGIVRDRVAAVLMGLARAVVIDARAQVEILRRHVHRFPAAEHGLAGEPRAGRNVIRRRDRVGHGVVVRHEADAVARHDRRRVPVIQPGSKRSLVALFRRAGIIRRAQVKHAADHARGDLVAVLPERLDQRRVCRVGDVINIDCDIIIAAAGKLIRGRVAARPVGIRREDDRAAVGQIQLQRQLFLRVGLTVLGRRLLPVLTDKDIGHVRDVRAVRLHDDQFAAAQDVDIRAVGLDDIALVDARDLHVRAGVECALAFTVAFAAGLRVVGSAVGHIEGLVAVRNRFLRIGQRGVDLAVALGKGQAAGRHRLASLPILSAGGQQCERQAQHQKS